MRPSFYAAAAIDTPKSVPDYLRSELAIFKQAVVVFSLSA